jgi:mediator of replication checkpoint protein 1
VSAFSRVYASLYKVFLATTMTLSKEHTIAADFTVSDSPPDPIKRATHTYGRRKADPINHPDSSLTSRQSIYRTAPPDLDEEIPPSSSVDGNDEVEGAKDATPSKCDRRSRAKMNHSHEDDVGEDEGTKNVPSFTWDWQKRLEEMDHWDEDEGNDLPVVASVLAGGNTLQNSDHRDLDISLPGHRDITSSYHQGIGPIGSLPRLASTSSPPLAGSPFSPNPREYLKKRINKDDSEFKKANIMSSPTSPAFHHHINTPKLHSSPTPPTSDEGEDFGGPPTKTVNKGKAKETSDPLLNFEEGASSSGTHNFTKIQASKATGMLRRKKNSKIKVCCAVLLLFWLDKQLPCM